MPMTDRFAHHVPTLADPATHGFAVTPDDGADLEEPSRAVYVGLGGALAVRMLSGQSVTLEVPAGSLLPIRVVRVLSTGTTADGIVAFV
ncbi:spike base protein, RCAP_Rcc01079 family [Ensifer soli]|uniref:spike base protein, RCAP_Rcc01079 family n=1 Tax=Ciceribacter sp. sgz301302 TaxID=3342379 RepID=UPI0035B71CE8